MGKKNLVGNFIGSKKIGSDFFWVKKRCWSDIFLGKKKIGSDLSVMLLVTGKLNNNNTEFLWWVGGLEYPKCSQTNFYLVMVELGFDKIPQITKLPISAPLHQCAGNSCN